MILILVGLLLHGSVTVIIVWRKRGDNHRVGSWARYPRSRY
jgi:hypothetical protein